MKKQILSVVLVVAMAMGMLAGCGEKASNKETSDQAADSYTIGFVPMTLNNEYFIAMCNGAQEKADELGVKLEVQAADSHASAADQLTIVENMITSGVDAICIVPSSSEGLETALKKCEEAGILVFNIDTMLDESVTSKVSMEIPFYGTDNKAGGVKAGEYVKENFAKGTKTAILTGIETQQNSWDRRDGFIEGVGDAVEIVATQSANWEVDQGYDAAQNIITANPDLELIYCCNDSMAIGASKAVKEAGLESQIKIIGFDGASEALNLVKDGEFAGTVAQDPVQMGKLGVENAVKSLKGEKVEQYLDTGSKLITADNVDEQLKYITPYIGE
ncbi:MAG: sugar ABC transporter substrate-binding protein [Velocimicrobium sp.]